MEFKTISANDFTSQLQAGKALNILDVRNKAEHAEKHLLAPHKHIPIDAIKPEELGDKEQTLYILCGGGTRATRAAGLLAEHGFENTVVITGGLRGCIAAGAEIVGANIKSAVTCNS